MSTKSCKPAGRPVWAKTNGGMGSLYRSQHELVFGADLFAAGFQRRLRRDRLNGPTLLHDQIVPLLGQFQLRIQVGQAIAKFELQEPFTDFSGLPNKR